MTSMARMMVLNYNTCLQYGTYDGMHCVVWSGVAPRPLATFPDSVYSLYCTLYVYIHSVHSMCTFIYCILYVYIHILYTVCVHSHTVYCMCIFTYCTLYVYIHILYTVCVYSHTVYCMCIFTYYSS